ncbi:MAG: hypothetical protein JO348_09045 [Alphaproteobacteria bacterium]|nr:hypothetical protein [Alphaproteobacteria bacterium]
MSDTMISDPKRVTPNVIPGVLKSVVVNLKLSVAYAGSVESSLNTVRSVQRMAADGVGLDPILDCLAASSADGRCEFVVSSHMRGAELRTIKKGRISASLDSCWVGDSAGFDKIIRINRPFSNGEIEFVTRDEIDFCGDFQNLFVQQVRVSDSIGGLAINQLSSPFGHTYQNWAFAALTRPITIGPQGVPPEQAASRMNEQHDYKATIVAPNHRGVAVLGAYFEQGAFGYLYSPLESDEAIRIAGIALGDLTKVVTERAEKLGGVIVD